MAQGRFISFEGGEGAGKTTQIRRLVAALEKRGIETIATREPGGTKGAEEIRALLVRGSADRWSPLTEALLHNAARSDHLDRVIRPALDRNAWVVTDRFADSTRAYQGHALGLGEEAIGTLEDLTVSFTRPDITFILDLPVEEGLARARAREADAQAGEDRYEGFDVTFHEKLRQGFLAIARAEPERCKVVDARDAADAVSDIIWQEVARRFPEVAG